MDSVFFGPEERQVTVLEFTNVSGNVESITVAELLSWIEHFAGVEAPQLIEDSGKDGVAIRSRHTLPHRRFAAANCHLVTKPLTAYEYTATSFQNQTGQGDTGRT